MKIRSGFVSNSSSSSFCIYGATIDTVEFVKGLIENFGNISEIKKSMEDHEINDKFSNEEEEEDYFCESDEEIEFIDDTLEILIKKGINPNCTRQYEMNEDSNSEVTIGRDYLDIDDNETGKEFKEKVEKFIKRIVKTDIKFEQMQEAFMP